MGDNTGGSENPPLQDGHGAGNLLDIEMEPSGSTNVHSKENNVPTGNNNVNISQTFQNNRSKLSEEVFLYEDKDQGPFFVFIESIDESKNGVARMHPMSFGRMLKTLFADIEILKLVKNGKNRIKIQVPSRNQANKIIQSNELKLQKFKAYVPMFILFRQGIVRGVDTDLTEDEILKEITILFGGDAQATAVRRFNRRISENGSVKYVPTGTIQVTFRAQSLPTHISIYYIRCEVEK